MGRVGLMLIAWTSSLISAVLASSATNRLPLYEFKASQSMWADSPGRACTESHQLKPPWAWPVSRLHLHIDMDLDSSGVPNTEGASTPILWEKSLPGGICHWLSAIPAPDELCGASPACLAASGAGRRIFDALCEDCNSKLCAKQAMQLGTGGSFLVELPPHGGCIHIEQLPKSQEGANKVRLTWENVWDPWVAVRVIVGVALMAGSQTLCESSFVHAALGGAGSVVVMSLFMVWMLVRELKSLNLSQSALSVAVLSTMFGTGYYTMSDWVLLAVRDPWAWAGWAGAWLAVRDPYYDLPIGSIFATAVAAMVSCAILYGARLAQCYFASPDEPSGDVEFTIGSDGRRIDVLPPASLQQRCLGWVLWAAGVSLLLRCSHDNAVSAAVFAAVLLRNRASFLFSGWFEESSLSPEYFRPLMSSSAYGEQSKRCTAAAIAQLQSFIRGNPEEMDAMGDDSTKLHLRRFSDGKVPHFMRSKVFEDNDGVQRGFCTLL